MALNDLNKNAISFKKIVGKTHTNQNFAYNEESITSNVQMSYSTVFGEPILPTPATTSGLTTPYATDGIVELLDFEITIIPDTQIGTNQSQGYRINLPSDYSTFGYLKNKFSSGQALSSALGKLQIVPPLYGALQLDGTTQYDPILKDTTLTVIPKFSTIDWIIDNYSGTLFVQSPPASFDILPGRPAFVRAFLYVGDYIDAVFTGLTVGTTTASNLGTGAGLFAQKVVSDLQFKSLKAGYGIGITTGATEIILSYTGATGGTGTGSTNVTASNGLTKSGNNIYLGGTLTGDTTIAANGKNFNLTGADGILLLGSGSTTFGSTAGNVVVAGNGLNMFVNGGGPGIQMNSSDMFITSPSDIQLSSPTGTVNFASPYIYGQLGSGGLFKLTGSTGFDLVWDSINKRFSAGNSVTALGSLTYTFGDGNRNEGAFGSVVFGELSFIDPNIGSAISVSEGGWVRAYGGKAFGRGAKVNVNGINAFVGGMWEPGTPAMNSTGLTETRTPQADGLAAFAFYTSDGAQSPNHGANAPYSAILGGKNHNIPSNATSSAILGGELIKAESGVTHTVYLPKLRIGQGSGASIPVNNANASLLSLNPSTGEVEIRLASSISGGTGSTAQNIYYPKVVLTADTTLTNANWIVMVDVTSTNITVDLPASPMDGQAFKIKSVGANNGFSVIVDGNGNNIDGSSTAIINTWRGGIELMYEAALNEWLILSFVP